MASDAAGIEGVAPERTRGGGGKGRTALKWAGIVLGILLLLVLAIYAWIESDPGRRFIVRQINQLETASGLDIEIGRIEGSVFGEMVVHDLRLSDPQGLFFRAPRVEVDWRPFAYLDNHVDIRSLEIPLARLYRLPELRTVDPDAPLLPDIDIDVGSLNVERLIVDEAVTGNRHVLSLQDSIHIADRRAQVELAVRAIDTPGTAGGDELVFELDAVPEENRLAIALRLQSPEDGFVTGLLGLDRPISARLQGRGTWADWQGRLRAAVGGEGVADVAIGAEDGTFTVRGPVRAGAFLSGPAQRLVQPFVQLDLTAALEDRAADIRLRANSRALAVAAEGGIDLGENRFEDLRIAARLIEPGAVAPDLVARDLRLAAVLNGDFATPRVAYDLEAARLGFGDTVLEGFAAQGAAEVDADRIRLPISARARRVTGIDPQFAEYLTNARVDGVLNISWPRIVSENLRLRSDRLDAELALAFDVAAGRYNAMIEGTLEDYRIEGVGIFDVTASDLDVTSTPEGFRIDGRFVARSERILNESVRDFLGGQATIRGRVQVAPSGTVQVDDIRLSSPELTVTSGQGVYRPDGTLDFTLSGRSAQYGPLTVNITGTASQPNVRLRAESPDFGIGLRGVDADVRATAEGYAIRATGLSDYGPFEADVTILSREGPLTIDVRQLTFAGFEFQGRVQRSPAGPFVGTLRLAGQGLSGDVELSAAGAYQKLQISAVARDARIPAEPPILVQRGIVRATAILYPDNPAIVADVQLAGVRSEGFFLDQARARIDYRGGEGRAQLVAEGRSGVPFEIALNADLDPNLIRAAVRGEANGIPFRTVEPAIVRNENGVWRLAPTAIALPDGRIRLAGSWGDGLVIQSRLDDANLSMFNAVTGLGLGGEASGSLDFAQPADGAFPRAEARLTIENFTRTGIGGRSVPVNLAFAGSLVPEGGRASAVIRRGGAVIGRVQARLQPLPPGAGSWTERLMGAPLSGGIRYNGPAGVLTSLAGVTGHRLGGPIGLAADFAGRVRDPDFRGLIRANNLTYVNEEFGTRVTGLAVDGRFDESRLIVSRLAGQAGEGTVAGSGSIGLAAEAGFPIDFRLQLDNATIARSDNLRGAATGTIRIVNNQEGARISGELALPEARYQFVRGGAAEVPQLAGVRRAGEPLRPPGAERAEAEGVPSIWQLDLDVVADNRIYVSGMGMESEWAARLGVEGTTATPRIVGSMELIRGTLSLAGRRFRLTDGDIDFTGARPPDPRINIEATSEIDGVEVVIDVSGSSTDPQIAFRSQPALPQDEIVSRILFGSSVTEISAIQAIQLAASLNTLRGGGGGLNPLGQLRSATGIDRLRILGADETTGRGTAVAAGLYLSDDIYIELITDARGFTATQLEIALSRTLSLLSQFGSTSGTNATFRYSKDY